MKYQGGKTLISKPISEIILAVSKPNTTFVSLFCGALSVESKVAAHKNITTVICNDLRPHLAPMYSAVCNGMELPDTYTKEKYIYLKEHLEEFPKLAGFIGFACSFGGKWFGGWASGNTTKGSPRNYCDEGKRGLLKKLESLKDTIWLCKDYTDVEVPDGAIVYADPPYNNTTGYKTGKFDTTAFWEYMRILSSRCTVFISELEAPDDFECIWERQVTRSLNVDKSSQKKSTEKLFKWKGESNT